MRISTLPLAVFGLIGTVSALPAAAQQMAAEGRYLQEAQLAPVQDVVLAAKQRMKDMGYDVQPNSQFDANLRNNVVLFQSDHGLRPTGNVDLSTLAAMGLDVDVRGGPAVAAIQREPGEQYAMADEQAAAPAAPAPLAEDTVFLDPRTVILRDEHMSSPQRLNQGSPLEAITGVPQADINIRSGKLAAVPGYHLGADTRLWD